jgi:hypothetical protein
LIYLKVGLINILSILMIWNSLRRILPSKVSTSHHMLSPLILRITCIFQIWWSRAQNIFLLRNPTSRVLFPLKCSSFPPTILRINPLIDIVHLLLISNLLHTSKLLVKVQSTTSKARHSKTTNQRWLLVQLHLLAQDAILVL